MSNTALIILLWVKVLFFAKKCWFLAKKKSWRALKGVFSETTYVCVLSYEISSF